MASIPFQRLYKLFRPYFGYATPQKRYHSMLTAVVFIGHVLDAILATFVNSYFNALIGTLSMEGVTYALFFRAVASYFAVFLVSLTLSVLTLYFLDKLAHSLAQSLSNYLANDRWFSSHKAFYGLNLVLMEAEKAELNVSKSVGRDAMGLGSNVVYLASEFIRTGLLFVVSAYALWTLSFPLAFSLLSTTLIIPGCMMIGAILYSFAFNRLSDYFAGNMKETDSELEKVSSRLDNEIHRVQANSENIALKNGMHYERKRLSKTFAVLNHWIILRRILDSKMFFLRTVTDQFSSAVAFILAAPSVIEKKIAASTVYGIVNHFYNVVQFLTWKRQNSDYIVSVDIQSENIERFLEQCSLADRVFAQSKLKREFKISDAFKINNITLKAHQNDRMITIIKNVFLEFPLHKITLLSAENGTGKSMLLKWLKGVWPYGEGEIHLPKGLDENDIYFMPQRFYIPDATSLLGIILYPCDIQNIDPSKKREVVRLLRRFEFDDEMIRQLEVSTKDWSGLSGGQRQRLAFIAAIIHKPKILLMDEPTSSMDKRFKELSEQIIKQELPGLTGALVDHNPSHSITPFYDHEIHFSANANKEFILNPPMGRSAYAKATAR